MRGRVHHLAEERLFDCYVAERAGEAIDPPLAEHLVDCAECGARYGEFARFMDGLRTDADAELDEIFPPEWHETQRQQIAGRLAHIGHVARVISFPGRLVARHVAGTASRIAPRWAAAAAAAGLFVGVAVGMFYDSRSHLAPAGRPTAAAVVRPTAPAAVATSGPSTLDTDAFLSELEGALVGPRTPELMSLDVLTPHVREIGMFTQ